MFSIIIENFSQKWAILKKVYIYILRLIFNGLRTGATEHVVESCFVICALCFLCHYSLLFTFKGWPRILVNEANSYS